MKKIELTIYIGNVAKNMIETDDFAYVDVKGIYVPHGYNSTGLNAKIKSISTLRIYICDWHDLLKDFNCSIDNLSAKIVLNISSNKKVFKGNDIIDFVDKLSKKSQEEIYKMRDFKI